MRVGAEMTGQGSGRTLYTAAGLPLAMKRGGSGGIARLTQV